MNTRTMHSMPRLAAVCLLAAAMICALLAGCSKDKGSDSAVMTVDTSYSREIAEKTAQLNAEAEALNSGMTIEESKKAAATAVPGEEVPSSQRLTVSVDTSKGYLVRTEKRGELFVVSRNGTDIFRGYAFDNVAVAGIADRVPVNEAADVKDIYNYTVSDGAVYFESGLAVSDSDGRPAYDRYCFVIPGSYVAVFLVFEDDAGIGEVKDAYNAASFSVG